MKIEIKRVDTVNKENQIKSIKIYYRLFFIIIDYLIIGYKLYCLVGYVLIYRSASNNIAQKEVFHYLIPFIIYAIIGVIRILKYQKLSVALLFMEVIFNIYFIITVSQLHVIYLALTIISFSIILRLYYNISFTKTNNFSDY